MKAKIVRHLKNWARKNGLQPDEQGYLPCVEQNLFQPMTAATKIAFDRGAGGELDDSGGRAKMCALHSSSALAVNFFDPWVELESEHLLQSLGIQSNGGCSIAFEVQYPTGLSGTPPTLDVSLKLTGGRVVAVESKFTEWLQPKPQRMPGGDSPFSEKYFPGGKSLWAEAALPNCQNLATRFHRCEVVYRHLDVAQLLKHVLGLATVLGDQFELIYVFRDANSREGQLHWEEIEMFKREIGTELAFRALSYQAVVSHMDTAGVGSKPYRDYLKSKYFPELPEA